jgi:hypothetical protein
MPDAKISTQGELQQSIKTSWAALVGFLEGLGDGQWVAVRDHEGWNVRDHVTHITAWEQSVAVLFEGEPRPVGLGVDSDFYATASFDQINAVIRERRQRMPPEEAFKEMRRIHAGLMAGIEGLSDADLSRSVADAFAQAPPDDDRRVIDIIYENTAQHFNEHLAWMLELVGARL